MARVVAGCLVLLGALSAQEIRFQDVTAKSGIDFITHSSPTPEKQQPEAMVAGVAIFDFDNDGFMDIYLVNGAQMPSLQKKLPDHKNRLYRNNGDLTFTDVTDKAGVAGSGYGMGVVTGDYDNDGWTDLYLPSLTANQLFRNNRDGTFADVTAKAGVAGGTFAGRKMWSVAGAFFDYNDDGHLDLFVSNYCQWDPANAPVCEVNGHRVSCNPRYFKPLPNTLYRNNGDGTFKDVSVETGIAKHLGRGMGVGIADYDDDGFQDIYVANDDAPSQLFHNMRGKSFEEVGHDSGVALPELGNVISGMGVEFKDVTNEGRPDLWVTAVEKETFPLYLNTGKGQFFDSTASVGLGRDTYQMSGWSNAVVDFDADGWKDLFVARSNVIDNVALFSSRTYEEPNTIFRNVKGKFTDASTQAGPALSDAAVHRGAAYGDLDNDGRMDLVVTVLNGKAKVLHNVSSSGNNWLLLHLTGSGSNRSAIGAQLKLTASDGTLQTNHLTTSSGYASASDPRVYFGLGKGTAKELEIKWPDGSRQILRNVPVNQIAKITQPRAVKSKKR